MQQSQARNKLRKLRTLRASIYKWNIRTGRNCHEIFWLVQRMWVT